MGQRRRPEFIIVGRGYMPLNGGKTASAMAVGERITCTRPVVPSIHYHHGVDMDLSELMDQAAASSVLHVSDEGERLVAMRLADDWDVGLRLHRRGSYRKWNVLEIAVRPRGDQRSITGNDVRELPLGSLIEEARRLATKSAAADIRARPTIDLSTLLADRGNRFGSDDDVLAALAFEYVAILEAGSRTPSRELAERFGGAAGTWTNRVGEARARGFLTPVERGEAGGALTPKALALLGISRG